MWPSWQWGGRSTTPASWPRIIERTKQEHPYEVPSVVALPIIDGNPDYIGWILEETAAR